MSFTQPRRQIKRMKHKVETEKPMLKNLFQTFLKVIIELFLRFCRRLQVGETAENAQNGNSWRFNSNPDRSPNEIR